MYEQYKVDFERTFRRGEMYWIRSADGFGSEQVASRPGVIISNDIGNEKSPVMQIVYCTTSDKKTNLHVELKSSPKSESKAICNQIYTIDKFRVGTKICRITEEEMRNIEICVANCLALKLHTKVHDEEIEKLNDKIAALESELQAKDIEMAMCEKCYDKAIEMMAAMRINADLEERTKKESVTPPPAPTPIITKPPVVVEEKSGVKVNVNTASAAEISEKTGLSLTVAFSVTGHRKREGLYKSLKDLLSAPKFNDYHLKTYGHLLEV